MIINPSFFSYVDDHFQATIHPTQDRVLSIRECARVQGFTDDYKFSGPVKERYKYSINANHAF